MKILAILCLAFGSLTFAQENTSSAKDADISTVNEKDSEVDIKAEKPAEFPKGDIEFQNMVYKNFRMRKVSNPEKKEESCKITFIVDKEGNLTNIQAEGNNEEFNKEAVRAVAKIKDKWLPAEYKGKKVRYKFRIPLTIHYDY